MVFNITEHVQGVQYLLRFWRSDFTVLYSIYFAFSGKIPMNNSSFKLKSFTNAPLDCRFCLWWESFFNGGHFSTYQTRKKSTPVTFFLHMRHVFLRPGVISLRRKMTPRSIFDGVVIRRYTGEDGTTQERKVCDVEIEIISFIINGSVKFNIPPNLM